MKTCSLEMKKYFQTWLDCTNGKSGALPFFEVLGLCGNVDDYTSDDDLYGVLTKELKKNLKDQYTNSIYPFGGHEQYIDDAQFRTMHKNPERIAFVKQFLE